MIKRQSLIFVCLFLTVVVEINSAAETTTKKASKTTVETTTVKHKDETTESSEKKAEKAGDAEDEDLRYTTDELMTQKKKFLMSCKQTKFCQTFLAENSIGVPDCNKICEGAWQEAEARQKKGENPMTPPRYVPELEPTDLLDGSGETTKKGPGLGVSGFKQKNKDKQSKGKKPKKVETKDSGGKNEDSDKEAGKNETTTTHGSIVTTTATTVKPAATQKPTTTTAKPKKP